MSIDLQFIKLQTISKSILTYTELKKNKIIDIKMTIL